MAAAETTMVEFNESALVAGVRAGDADCFNALHKRYSRSVYGYALKRLGDHFDAEDVTQEVFLQVFRCIDGFEGRSALSTWIFGIACNLVYRRYRSRGPATLPLNTPEVDRISSTQVPADRRADAVRVLRSCGRVLEEKVSPDRRQVFELRYLKNLSTLAIANELGKTPQAIKTSLFRTRRTLVEHNGRELERFLIV